MTYAERIPTPAAILECRRIVDIAQSEIERRRERADIYGRQCISDLNDIIFAALAIEDWFAGADDEPLDLLVRELDSLLGDWAEVVDYRTFIPTPALDATWNTLAEVGKAA